jgi:two-component system, NtrC family, response regulator GlrR
MSMGSRGYDDRVQTALLEERAFVRCNPTIRWADTAGSHALTLEGTTVIGSAPRADLVVAHPSVSRIHAELDPRSDGLWVRDLGSRNGTFIEGIRVTGGRVPDGGELRLGGATLVVGYPDERVPVSLWPSERFCALVGTSSVMRALFARLERIAATESTVMITGETGTGKELVAHAIHERSRRAGKPFVVVDCGAIPDELFESELFGHVRGAFTGAATSRTGALETASGGTVFLDEVGELSPAVQPKLLRAIESRTVRAVGDPAYRPIDVRFISATHRDLREMVNAGAFREDLYFRLSVVPVRVPSLRERAEDIAPLVTHFLAAAGMPASQFPSALVQELAGMPWLGNVRALRNFVERALALGPSEALAMTPTEARALDTGGGIALDRPLKELREEVERTYLQGLLAKHGRNINAVAAAAGIDRTYVYRLMKKYALV